jgi:hypothetical protein
MNDVGNVVEPSEALDGDGIGPLGVVDLGDAMTETKQMAPTPFVIDNYMQWGWNA